MYIHWNSTQAVFYLLDHTFSTVPMGRGYGYRLDDYSFFISFFIAIYMEQGIFYCQEMCRTSK
jgi:hypothetical protein